MSNKNGSASTRRESGELSATCRQCLFDVDGGKSLEILLFINRGYL
jgi:hypothetical protein